MSTHRQRRADRVSENALRGGARSPCALPRFKLGELPISPRLGRRAEFYRSGKSRVSRQRPLYPHMRDIVTRHAVQALDGFRTLFKYVDEQQMVDINSIALEVLRSLHGELRAHGIKENLELTAELPLSEGNRDQLQQVLFNLVHNAVEAMQATTNRDRLLRLTTKRRPDTIALAAVDSGPGIDPKRLDSIFEAFVTTKERGMGLGLAICRMITERHGGRLTASSDGKSGALFQLILPIKSPARTHIARA